MPVGAGIAISTVVSAGIGLASSRQASKSIEGSSAAAIAEQRRQFDLILGLTSGGRQVGNEALNTLASLFIPGFEGLNVGGSGGSGGSGDSGGSGRDLGQIGRLIESTGFFGDSGDGDTSDGGTRLAPVDQEGIAELFRNLPGVQFEIDQAEKSVGNSFASRGGAFGGNAIRALGDRTGEIASSRVVNNLLQLAGFGPQATGIAANAAANTGTNISGILTGAGFAQAQNAQNTGASVNNAIQGGLNNFLLTQLINK